MEEQIVYKRVDELKLNEKNPRKNDNAVKEVAESIKQFGFRSPLIIKDDIVWCGNTRLKAAKLLGLEKVPCLVADDLTKTEIRKLALLDNKLNEIAEWDYDLLKDELDELDLSDFDLEWGIPELETEEKEVEEDNYDIEEHLPENPKAKLGDIYQLGEHRLMCGDSTKAEDVEKLMGEEKADLVFTDPPYGVSYKGTNNPNGREWEIIKNDDLRGDGLFLFLLEAFKNIKRALKTGGAFYIWYANSNSLQFENALLGAELKKKQIIIWQKGMVLGHSDYHWTYEPCLYGCHPEQNCEWYGDRTQKTLWNFNNKELKDLKKEQLFDIVSKLYENKDIWEIKRDWVQEYIHPTQKPIALSAKALNNSSIKGQIVLDLFGGSGSTLMGCEQMHRKARIMEFDPKYVDAIINRWETYTGKKAVKIC